MAIKRFRVVIFYIVISMFWMSMYVYVPNLSSYSSKVIGASDTMVGSIIGIYGLTQLLLRVPLGILSDKLGRRKIFVVLGCAVSAISAMGLALSRGPVGMLFFRGLAGVAASAWVTFTVLFSSYFDADEAPKAMLTAMICNNLGQMTATLLGGVVSERLGSVSPFWFSAITGMIAVLLSLFVMEKRPETSKSLKVVDLLKVGTDKQLLVVSGLAVLYQVINQGTTFGFTPKLLMEIGGTDFQKGLLNSVSIFGMAIMSLITSNILIKKMPPRYCIWIGQAMTASAACLIPIIGKTVPVVFVLQFILGMGNGLSFPLMMGMAIKNISPEKRGAAMGFFQSIYALGMYIGPQLVGILSDEFNLGVGIFCVGLLGFAGFAIALFALREKQAV
ncbi:MAG: MFS transporter [Christensenellales bacterium]|jgi:MFS family permease